jgi:hypothetical protein
MVLDKTNVTNRHEGTYMRTKGALKLAIIPPNCSEFFSECIQACFQIWCSEAGMEYGCCQQKKTTDKGIP